MNLITQFLYMLKAGIYKYTIFLLAIIFLYQDISAQQLTLFKSAAGKYGYKDAVGKEVVPAIYDNVIFDEASGLISVKLNNKYGIINKNGMPVADIKYDYSAVSEGLCLVELDKKYGYLDSKGKEVIPLIYDDANLFSEGLARVKLKDKCGIIDKTGKVIVPFKYDNIFGFKNGRAGVVLDFKYGFIDKKGNEIVPVKSLYYLKARLASDPSVVISFSGDFPSAYLSHGFCLGDTLQIKRPVFIECPYCSGYGTYTANEKKVFEKWEVVRAEKVGTFTEKIKGHMEYYDNKGNKHYPISTKTFDQYAMVKSTVLLSQIIADKFVCPLVSDSEHEKRKQPLYRGGYYLHEFILIWNNEVEEYYAYPILRAKSTFSLTN